MSKPSEPTKRVIALLELLAQHPDEGFSLAHLSRELEISKSTLHAITNTLVEAGFMLRGASDLRLSLGPALIPLGHAALGKQAPYIEAARPAMRALAQELGSHCVVTVAVGDRMYIVASEGNPKRIVTTFHDGQMRQPIIPPFGSVFIAWRDADEIDAWLDRATHLLDPLERAYYQSTLDTFHRAGFAVAARLNASARIENAIEEAGFTANASDDPRRVINELLEDMRADNYLMPEMGASVRDVDWIAAPVFDDRDQVIMALTLTNFQAPMTAQEIQSTGDRLRAVARDATDQVRGT
ncbi:helix-turn-helix domain-containing protein [soil metagenome]